MIATDAASFAIATADQRGTLKIVERESRYFAETFITIEDEMGMIEVATSRADADARIAEIRKRLEAPARVPFTA